MRHFIQYGNAPETEVSEDEYIEIWERCGSPKINSNGCFAGIDPEDNRRVYGRATSHKMIEVKEATEEVC